MRTLTKDWDRHVVGAEQVDCGHGLQELRDRILTLAEAEFEAMCQRLGRRTLAT